MTHFLFIRALPLAAFAGALVLSACEKAVETKVAPPPEVGVETTTRAPLLVQLNYSGNTAGSREVEVRARISGILLKRRYQEGAPVRKDSLLFELDPEPARAAVEQARAEAAVQLAVASQSQRERERVESVFKQGLVSLGQRDQVVAGAEIAAANLLAAQAKLRKAELDLSYCEVRAPISGLASNEARSEGSLVTAGQESSLLTRIVQVDPLYVEFTVPDHEAAILRDALAAAQRVTARVTLADGSDYPQPAQLTFLDNAVEMRSGSVAARAILPNPEMRLIPGQFVRVRIEGLNVADATSVPRKAVLTNNAGHFVWVVDAGKVTQRTVQLGATVGERVIIKRGLSPGEQVVVDGIMKVADGKSVAIVTPSSMTISSALAAAGKN